MRLLSTFSSAVLLGAALVAAAEGSDVIDLTPANFATVVDPEPLILVEFFAPWCGHCKALAPQYEEAATALKGKNIKLAKVDCVDQADLCQKFGVQGYPTLKVFKNGTPTEYGGPRKAEGIITYMVKQSLPAVNPVNAENHEEIKIADKVVAIAYLASATEAPAAVFSAVAEKHRDDWLFGLSTDEAVISAAGVKPPAIVLYRKFDEPRIDFETRDLAAVTEEQLTEFIKSNGMPLVDEVTPENYAAYAGSGLPLAYLFIEPTDEKHAEFVAMLRPSAQKHKGKVNFVFIDATKFADHAKALNIPEAKWPAFVIQDTTGQLKYPLDQNVVLTADEIASFSDKFASGELKPRLKSEPVPEFQDESVFVLVSSEFDDVVFNDEKDVLIEFYAPWCGHCKRLKPTWDSLGDKYVAVKDRITIAKMDATENDLPASAPFRVSGFPTIKFKPAGTRDFIDYEGDRSLESLIEFVETNAKNSLVVKAPPKDKSADAEVPPVESPQVVMSDVKHEPHDEL